MTETTFHQWAGAEAKLVLQAPGNEVLTRLEGWTKEWFKENQLWAQEWRTGARGSQEVRIEHHKYQDSFEGPPVLQVQGSTLYIAFKIRDKRSYWRDWIILKFRADFSTAFSSLKIQEFRVEDVQ